MDVLMLAQKADLFAALERANKEHGLVIEDIEISLDISDDEPNEVFKSFSLTNDEEIDSKYIHAFMKAVGEKIIVPADAGDGIYFNMEGDGAYLLKDSEIDVYMEDLKKVKIPHQKDIGFEMLPEDKGVVFKYNRQNALQIVEAIGAIAQLKKDKKEDIAVTKEKRKAKRDKLKAAATEAKKKSTTKQDKMAKKFKEILARQRREG